jgi:thiamine-phosphate pyrophosphorylase
LIIIILRAICEAVSIPVVVIGGITQNNVIELTGTGICGVAVISAIFAIHDLFLTFYNRF